jgi:hypothetical protein
MHRNTRHHRKFGWPELWLVCLIVLAVGPPTVWWQRQYKPDWKKTAGHITASESKRVHYNAQDYRMLARVSYEYTVGMAKYTGNFDGFWPEIGSPNALAPAEIDTLKQPKKEVVVFYDPDHAERSTLHLDNTTVSPFWVVLTAAGLAIAGAYTFFVYPAWRG